MKNIIVYLVLGVIVVLAVFFTFSAGKTPSEGTGVRLVDSAEFEGLVSDESVFVLQAHTPYYGEIEGTDIVLEDWENVGLHLNELPSDKSMPIAVYCRSGRMSGIVAQELAELGYENVYDLQGGMNAWQDTGRELVVR